MPNYPIHTIASALEARARTSAAGVWSYTKLSLSAWDFGYVARCFLGLLPRAAIAQTPMPFPALTEAVEHHAEEVAIEHVKKQFHNAVAAHNGATLSHLFLPEANIWLNLRANPTYHRT